MDWIKQFIEFFLHFDDKLAFIIQNYGAWTYAFLFLIIFCETGLVIAPLLPGDSLLFAAGTFAALGHLNIAFLIVLFIIAAILGDATNYGFGYFLGPKAFSNPKSKIFRPEYLEKTQYFYDKYGGKTIIIARFMPIVRTFAPFVAGVGKMRYRTFLFYNIVGAILWVSVCTLIGYLFGNIPIIKKNFEFAILGIIGISVLPMALELLKHRMDQKKKVTTDPQPVASEAE